MASDEAAVWREHVHWVLSRAGLKRGGARERVIELLAGQPCALTAVEIEDALRASGDSPGRASIRAASTITTSFARAAGGWSRSTTRAWSER